MKKLLPVLLALVGLGAGVGGGLALKPPAPELTPEEIAEMEHAAEEAEEETSATAFVKINNQFVVPVVKGERVQSLVVLSISLETKQEYTELLYGQEPKLRDAFLRVMFDHAYAGGFGGAFTASPTLDTLRASLLESARAVVDDAVTNVLITDIVRQDT